VAGGGRKREHRHQLWSEIFLRQIESALEREEKRERESDREKRD
jgi:hypothetical protein